MSHSTRSQTSSVDMDASESPDLTETKHSYRGQPPEVSDIFSDEEVTTNMDGGQVEPENISMIPDNNIELSMDVQEETSVDKADIFGESLSDLSAEEDQKSSDERSNKSEDGENNLELNETNLMDNPQGLEDGDDILDETRQTIRMKIPRIKLNLGNETHFVKIPNFLNVESRPFEPCTYVAENGMSDDIDELEWKRLRLRLDNTLRWRIVKTEDGLTRQSNTRFVQWSDGSLSLYVGDKPFDVFKNNISSDNNHLFVRHGSNLHGQGRFNTKLTFKPYSSDLNLSSRLVSVPLSRRSIQSQQKIRILSSAGQNPDLNRVELIKQEEKRMKREERRRNLLEKRKEEARSATRRQVSSRYLERGDSESDSDEGDEYGRKRSQESNDMEESQIDGSERAGPLGNVLEEGASNESVKLKEHGRAAIRHVINSSSDES